MRVRKLRFIFLLLALLCYLPEASEAKNLSKKKEHGCRGFFIPGVRMMELKSLSSVLEDKGYGKISESFFSLGGGGFGVIGKVIVGGEGHGIIGKNVYSESFKTSIKGGYGLFDLGYMIYSKNFLNIYPILGIGGGSINLKIVEKGEAAFEEIMEDPKRGVNLSTSGFLLNISLTIDRLLKMKERERCGGGLTYGIRIGYLLAPFRNDWRMDKIKIHSGPKISFRGPYIALLFGGGGMCSR